MEPSPVVRRRVALVSTLIRIGRHLGRHMKTMGEFEARMETVRLRRDNKSNEKRSNNSKYLFTTPAFLGQGQLPNATWSTRSRPNRLAAVYLVTLSLFTNGSRQLRFGHGLRIPTQPHHCFSITTFSSSLHIRKSIINRPSMNKL